MDLIITNKNNIVTTTSMIVAEKFDKDHKNVLRDIRDMECSPEFSRLNFELSDYEVRGKKYPIYFITKDGFMMLAMGFTGEKAAKFRELFIDAFNKMEAALRAKVPVLLPTYQQRLLSEPAKSCPANKWCIFKQAAGVMFQIEANVAVYVNMT